MKADAHLVSYRPKLLLAAAAARGARRVGAASPLSSSLYQTQLLTYGLIAGDRRARIQSAARLHRAAVVRAFRLLRHRRLCGGVPAARRRHPLDGALHPDRRLRSSAVAVGAVRLYLRAPHAHLLRHPDARAVAGAVTPCLQVLLDHRRHRRAARAAGRPCSPAWSASPGADAFQRFINGYYYYVLGGVRDLRRGDVGDRPFPVRQGAAGDPRQRDPRRVPRPAHSAASAGSLS